MLDTKQMRRLRNVAKWLYGQRYEDLTEQYAGAVRAAMIQVNTDCPMSAVNAAAVTHSAILSDDDLLLLTAACVDMCEQPMEAQ